MRPFLTSFFRKKRTLSLPLYALLFICFASESFDGYFYLLYCSYIFASIFSAFCDLRLMNHKIHNRFQHVNVLFLFEWRITDSNR